MEGRNKVYKALDMGYRTIDIMQSGMKYAFAESLSKKIIYMVNASFATIYLFTKLKR